MDKEERRTLILMNILGLAGLLIVAAFFYYIFTNVIGHQLTVERLISVAAFLAVIIAVIAVPRVYIFIKKKPRIEPGNYSLEEVKGKE
ncbi:MAG TPA: hypothetical protein ENG74_03065 [Thermoplasmatales archaeon]|nr:hypothetical protein [Thermoplasmatales archaeon]